MDRAELSEVIMDELGQHFVRTLRQQAAERFFLEAHQRRLLEYHAAGSVVRIEFPTESIEEYARVLVASAAH